MGYLQLLMVDKNHGSSCEMHIQPMIHWVVRDIEKGTPPSISWEHPMVFRCFRWICSLKPLQWVKLKKLEPHSKYLSLTFLRYLLRYLRYLRKTLAGWWFQPLWKMMEFVNGKDDIPYIYNNYGKWRPCLKPPKPVGLGLCSPATPPRVWTSPGWPWSFRRRPPPSSGPWGGYRRPRPGAQSRKLRPGQLMGKVMGLCY